MKILRQAGSKNPFIAKNYKVQFTPGNSGNWEVFGDHYVWHLKIRSKGALGIAMVLSEIKLHADERLYIYNVDEINGLYTRSNIPASGILPLSYVRGDEIIIEYQVPLHTQPGTFTIETVSHAYIDPFSVNSFEKNAAGRINEECYVCLEGDSLQLAKRSVVKIIIHRDGGSLFCTGTLVNNTAENKRPYILTAEHCISNEADASRSIFIFDYDVLCNQTQTTEMRQITGATLLASSYQHDFAFMELQDYPPLGYKPYYAGWNLSSSPPGNTVSVHHPAGGPKRVSTSHGQVVSDNYGDDITRAPNAFWKIKKWDSGITEGGSSGAPLFNSQLQIIGTLTGGSAQCNFPFNDYFQKLAASVQAFPSLKQWLDPAGVNVQTMTGLDPFEDIDPYCEAVSNINTNESTGLESYIPGTGFYSGYNSDNISSYAEKFTVADSMMLSSASFSIGSVNTEAAGGLVIAVHQANTFGLPGSILHETFVPYKTLTESVGYVTFYPYIKVVGNFFISYTLNYSAEDVFAVNQALWRSDKSNTAYLKLPSGWAPMNEVSPQSAGTSFDIKADVCRDVSPEPKPESLTVDFYPNPSSLSIVGKLNFTFPERLDLQVFDLQGKQQTAPFQVVDNNVVINIATLTPGIYLLRMITPQKIFTAKMVKN